jgi:hypothetical protein
MTAMGEPPDRIDRAADQPCEPDAKARQSDENQLDLFKTAPAERADSGPSKQDLPERALLAGVSDPDELRRLEDSIRWLQNESGIRRLPRAATLLPVHGLPPFGAELRADAGPRHGVQVHPEDDADQGTQAYPLDANRLLLPRSSRRHGGTRGFVKFLVASAVAIPPAYFIANAPSLPTFGSLDARLKALVPAPKPRRSELVRISEGIVATPAAETPRATFGRQVQAVEAADANAVEATAAAAGPAPHPADLASLPADGAPDNAPVGSAAADKPQPGETAPGRAQPALSARDIALLVERGRGFFESGDVAAARLLFRRAANAGDAAAALAMGTTYDPAVLANRLVRGMGADLDEARSWYEKARELGSPEGPRRLEMLAHR